MGDEKYITINGRIKKDITNFKTIDDIVKEKEKVLKEKKNKDEIEKELEDFKNNASTLVKYIITKGQEIKRKTDNTKVKKYITIKELEDDFR